MQNLYYYFKFRKPEKLKIFLLKHIDIEMVEYEFIEKLSEKVKKFKQNPTPINGFKFPIEM